MQPVCTDCEGICTGFGQRGAFGGAGAVNGEPADTSLQLQAGCRALASHHVVERRPNEGQIHNMALECAGNVPALMYQLSSGLEIVLMFVLCVETIAEVCMQQDQETKAADIN